MNRKTLIAGLVFAGLILATVLLLRSPEKGESQGGGIARPIPRLGGNAFDTVEITKDKTTTVIKKEGDAYRIVKPISFAADKDGTKTAFEALAKMDFTNIVSDQKSRHDELELGDKSLHVILKKGEQLVADLRIGRTSGQVTMVRLEGKDQVYAVAGLYKYQLDKDTTAWRDKSITSFDEKDVDRIKVASKDGSTIVVAKPAPTDGGAAPDWQLVEASVKVEPFDKSVASGMASQLATFKANEFADDAKPEQTGLTSPGLTVTVTLRNGKEQVLLVGDKKGEEDWYVKTAAQPQIYLVKKYNLERINKRPVEFREKTICNLKAEELTEIAITHAKDSFTLSKQGDAWKATKPANFTADDSKISNITTSFADWKGQGFAEDGSPKATGLGKPQATIVAKSSVKGHGCQLKIGDETSDKSNYYVQTAMQPDVVLVPKWSVDRILVKLDDLKKK